MTIINNLIGGGKKKSELEKCWIFLKHLALQKWDIARWKTRMHKPYQMLLYRFRKEEDIEGKWMIHTDNGIGGKSSVSFSVGKQHCVNHNEDEYSTSSFAKFEGIVRPFQAQGFWYGYAAVFSEMPKIWFITPWMNWGKYKYVAIRYRGDGNTYRMNIRCGLGALSISNMVYQYSFTTIDDSSWRTLKIPFEDFLYQSSSTLTSKVKMNTLSVLQVGFVFNPCGSPKNNDGEVLGMRQIGGLVTSNSAFNIPDKQYPFRLEIDHISVCNDADKTVIQIDDLGITHSNAMVLNKMGTAFKQKRRKFIYTEDIITKLRTRIPNPILSNESSNSATSAINSLYYPESLEPGGRKNSKKFRKDILAMHLSKE